MKPRLVKRFGMWKVEAAFGTPSSWYTKAQKWAERANCRELFCKQTQENSK
jgi:hypothetical protein